MKFFLVQGLSGSRDFQGLASHRVTHHTPSHTPNRQPQSGTNSPIKPIHTDIVLQSPDTQLADCILLSPTASVLVPFLQRWIRACHSIAVVLKTICTGLITVTYRILATHKRSAACSTRAHRGPLYVARILVESAAVKAALQLIVETVALALYCPNINT